MQYPVDSGSPGGDVVTTDAPVFLESFAEWEERYPRIAPIIGAVHLSAYAGLPLTFGGRVLGVVSFNFPEARTFTSDQRGMLLAFAAQCAQALERARLFSAEQRARMDAESATRAKSDFLAVMSHELRTPLTSILGYEELLADGISGPVTDLQRQQLSRIEASALHLLGLIDELLTLSRLETGHETVQLGAVHVAGLLDAAATLVAPLAAARRLTVTIEPCPSDLTVVTDVVKLRQVLVNLLSNAVKFTERGTVTLGARIEADSLVLDVRDTGIGIAAEHLERIFEPFWQIEQHSTRRAGGTGLGLSVSRRLTQLLGGTITVESTVGKGSVFRVRVPGA
jgi:signal transduction histidine kinase